MIVYLAILIPVLAGIILWAFFKHKTTWWEFAIPFAVSLVLIATFKACSVKTQTDAVEYWSGYVTHANYYEEWNEYIHRTCTRSCGKNCTTTYDCSYVETHYAYWEMLDNNLVFVIGCNCKKGSQDCDSYQQSLQSGQTFQRCEPCDCYESVIEDNADFYKYRFVTKDFNHRESFVVVDKKTNKITSIFRGQ